MKLLTRTIQKFFPAKMTVSAHCDGPCGIYDPASARIAAEAALSMTKKILALDPDDRSLATANSLSR
jgi:nickel superoxide dismutase